MGSEVRERLREGGGGCTASGRCSGERLYGRRPVCVPAQDGQSIVECCMLDHSPGWWAAVRNYLT